MRGAQMTCRELVELVSDYFEDALPERDRKRFRSHIRGCDACSNYLEQMRATIATTGRLAEESVSPEARDALLTAFRGWRAERS